MENSRWRKSSSPTGRRDGAGTDLSLQRFLKRKTPPYGAQPDRNFCWDLHVISCGGATATADTTFVRYDVPPLQWTDIPALFQEGMLESLTAAGFSQPQSEEYLHRAGATDITRTHGRREVAFLNRPGRRCWTWTCAWTTSSQAQPLLDHAVNTRPRRCAGSTGWERDWSGIAAVLGVNERI